MHETTAVPFGRRGFLSALALAAAGAAGGLQLLPGATPAAADGDAFDVLRESWAVLLTGGDIDATDADYAPALAVLSTTATDLWNTMAPDTGAGSLWPGQPLTVPANITAGYKALASLATAYATEGTTATDGTGRALHGSAGLGADIVAGLDFLHARAYHATAVESGNWWEWEIGCPVALTNAMTLVHPLLTEDRIADWTAAIDHFVPDPTKNRYGADRTTSTGANRVDLCQVVALRGVLGRSDERLAAAVAGLSDVFPYVTSDDGLYADGSFVQHTYIPYTGTYGMVLLRGLTSLFQLLHGSPHEVTDPAAAHIHTSVDTAFAPWIWNGLCMDAVRGRAVSRATETDFYDGNLTAQAVLRAALSAPATAQATRFKGLAKGWITRGEAYAPYSATAGIAGVALAAPVLNDSGIEALPEPVGHVQFPNMDRAVHRGRGWALALALSSARIARYESMNGENLHGWHTGDGMAYLYLAGDPGHFTDDFWPTADPKRMPGTTTDALALADAAGTGTRPAAAWAGGASLGGAYGSVGLDFRSYGSTLTAKKSWFCLDDSVVCLGAGITGGSGAEVSTTVEHRNLGAPGARTPNLTVDGTAQPSTAGWSATLAVTGWAHLAGVGGYLFPGGATVTAGRTDRTGSWHDINTGGTTTATTRRYLTLGLSHGTAPANGAYAYVLLPGADASRTAARAAAPTVEILANTPAVQAIRDNGSGVVAANFFTAGTAAGITVGAPCSVILRRTGSTLTVAVSDPTHTASPVTVRLVHTGTAVRTDPRITVDTAAPTLAFTVNTAGAAGATAEAVFTVTGAALAPVADGYVRDGAYAGTSYGTATTLVVKNATGSGYNRQSYLAFDTSALTGRVTSAALSVHGFVSDSGGTDAVVTAYGVAGTDWTEPALTWNTRPGLGAARADAAATAVPSWLTFDVTAHVTAAAPGPVSLALAQAAPGLAVVLNSRENKVYPPVLTVTLG
ncbi:DNRLRE domain-containing protein [Streptomyces sp. NBC_01335]|uniref:polysaccharide lyase family 8 super-sandwich domain-containing protein n=1 Tax=Streptomyces sp. NBC_01335 TaxID=2903828 RepID=UPI002E0E2D7C|nr:DNRLRE domain-containing protein [Streptomyces sp. NBC_01335]